MSRIVIMGASRGIGLETVKALLKAGHEVVAFSRSAEMLKLSNPALLKISGDATREDDVQIAIEQADIVVQDVLRPGKATGSPEDNGLRIGIKTAQKEMVERNAALQSQTSSVGVNFPKSQFADR